MVWCGLWIGTGTAPRRFLVHEFQPFVISEIYLGEMILAIQFFICGCTPAKGHKSFVHTRFITMTHYAILCTISSWGVPNINQDTGSGGLIFWSSKSHDPVVKRGEKSNDPVCVPPYPIFQLILGTPLYVGISLNVLRIFCCIPLK